MDLSPDEVTRLCQDLVYKVAYGFYDAPYIIMLRILVHLKVVAEKQVSEMLGIPVKDAQKYLGFLQDHRLVKSHVNKEKAPPQQQRSNLPYAAKPRDVTYWYLDYREFANVVKYRIAMMRRNIDIKVKNEAGKRGYLCPGCGKAYDPLDLAGTFDAAAGAFLCELCGSELVEDDPALHEDGQDRMSRFNDATRPIREALKAIEGARLPTLNIIAWIAQNVTTQSVAEVAASSAARQIGVVIGEIDDSKAKRDAEAQREQNAIPVWYTHSTLTGEATSLSSGKVEESREEVERVQKQNDDDALAAHYANMDEEEDDEMEEAELAQEKVETGTSTPVDPATKVKVMVNGVPKLLAEVTEADEELMTPEEYEAYFEATSAVV